MLKFEMDAGCQSKRVKTLKSPELIRSISMGWLVKDILRRGSLGVREDDGSEGEKISPISSDGMSTRTGPDEIR